MINEALINPKSIAVVGATNKLEKPGGRLVNNLKYGGFLGEIYPINPKESNILGLPAYNRLEQLPQTDMAIMAIPADGCVKAIKFLAINCATKAFIIISAGFSEVGPEGKALENELRVLVEKYALALIGPNCIGVINNKYKAVFVSPPPPIVASGADFVSASGAIAVFLFEVAAKHGLCFYNVYTVGNSLDIAVEDVLKYWDENFKSGKSSTIKMVYIEQVRKPEMFYKHINSLRKKGCYVVVLKPGESEAGNRAALSHTGALTGDAEAVGWLIEKAGAIRCYSREELVYISAILSQKPLKGNRIAIVTHAGGPAIILTDQLSKLGFKVPELREKDKKNIADKLHHGAAVQNPIDMLATANHEQLAFLLNYCDKLDYIDGTVVIYGSTGMEDLNVTYKTLSESMVRCNKPVYPVLPSINTAEDEIKSFLELGNVAFSDEVNFAKSLSLAANAPNPDTEKPFLPPTKYESSIIQPQPISETEVFERLKIAGIPVVQTQYVCNENEWDEISNLTFPVVAKVMGILHKTEVKGVELNIQSLEELKKHFKRFKEIDGATGVVVQEMIQGVEIYLGGKMHPGLGYSVHVGVGGVFIELVKDVSSKLAPINYNEAAHMLSTLKAQKLFSGFRNMQAIDKDKLAQILVAFSNIFKLYPDITEIDINPLMASAGKIMAVDARIIVSK